MEQKSTEIADWRPVCSGTTAPAAPDMMWVKTAGAIQNHAGPGKGGDTCIVKETAFAGHRVQPSGLYYFTQPVRVQRHAGKSGLRSVEAVPVDERGWEKQGVRCESSDTPANTAQTARDLAL